MATKAKSKIRAKATAKKRTILAARPATAAGRTKALKGLLKKGKVGRGTGISSKTGGGG